METVNIENINLKNGNGRKIQVETGIAADSREQIARGMSMLLADSYLLMLKTHFYHWNVKGHLFHTIHEMTEEQYNDLFSAVDDLAERIRALGFDAPGTFKQFQELSGNRDAKEQANEHEIIADLLQSHEAIVKSMRKVLQVADSASDEVTVDMLTQRLYTHEKYAWMWRSFLES